MQRSKFNSFTMGRLFKENKKRIYWYGGKRKIEQLDPENTYTLDDLLNSELGSVLNLDKKKNGMKS